MKRIPIPPSVIYHALIKHGPMAIDEIGLASRSHTIRMLLELRATNRAHICGWKPGELGRWRAVYAAGHGVDAPEPRMTDDERRAREREKSRQKRKAQLETPVMPTHHPTIGVWGI